MAHIHSLPAEWLPVSLAPSDADLEVCVMDYDGIIHALVFPCHKDKTGWVDASTKNASTSSRRIGANGPKRIKSKEAKMEKRIGSARHSAKCPSCGIKLISPKWSESTGTDDIVNLWRCLICGCDFATTDTTRQLSARTSDDCQILSNQ